MNNKTYDWYSQQREDLLVKLKQLKAEEKRRLKEAKARKKGLQGYQGKLAKTISLLWKHTFARLGEDWAFLALLGIIMGILSFIMDTGISTCVTAQMRLYNDLAYHPMVQFIAWVSLPVILILFAVGFVHLMAPQSIGSGIPEVKTTLRGVAIKECLTFKTLVAKVVGLTATLGAGAPVGKEGPFVHIASISATQLSKLVTGFQGIYENDSRRSDMLAAACAVGVAGCFSAPVGGVLFSIEVTTTYFAVRNYWRGFFAAVCGATTFRLLALWFHKGSTVTAIFQTSFHTEFPFDPQELIAFAVMGALCGLGGAFYVWVHRKYVIFLRTNKTVNSFFQKNRFLYPGIVILMVSILTFPPGIGQFMAGDVPTQAQIRALFSNFTWTKTNHSPHEEDVIKHWKTEYSGVFLSLSFNVIFTFIASIVCTTMPVPCGNFTPAFKSGAGIGRIFGELMHVMFPTGTRYAGNVAQIIPGGYATVAAAAFSGAVTHTVSTSVIAFEMTDQITHIIPMLLAVLISNAVASLFMPSIFDSVIMIKKLPYLPDLLPSNSGIYDIYVEDFMVDDVKYIFYGMTYEELKLVLKENRKLQSFPLVDKSDSMILLGSIQRLQLIQLIEKQIGKQRRLQAAAIRQREVEENAREEVEKQVENRQRKVSRFEVSSAPDMLQKQLAEDQTNEHQHTCHSRCSSDQPKKSILKDTNFLSLNGTSSFVGTSRNNTPYTTVTGSENRIRSAFEAIFRKPTLLKDVENGDSQQILNYSDSFGIKPQIVPGSPTNSKKVLLPKERVWDMCPEDQKIWEEEQMQLPVDFASCHIDPAPFQLVERTSLLKVHSLFSMVGVNRAFVTSIGKLVGVVGLKELRKAIEDANSGNLPPQTIDTNGTLKANHIEEPLEEVDASTKLVTDV